MCAHAHMPKCVCKTPRQPVVVSSLFYHVGSGIELRSSILVAIFTHRDITVGPDTRVLKTPVPVKRLPAVRAREMAQWLRELATQA